MQLYSVILLFYCILRGRIKVLAGHLGRMKVLAYLRSKVNLMVNHLNDVPNEWLTEVSTTTARPQSLTK